MSLTCRNLLYMFLLSGMPWVFSSIGTRMMLRANTWFLFPDSRLSHMPTNIKRCWNLVIWCVYYQIEVSVPHRGTLLYECVDSFSLTSFTVWNTMSSLELLKKTIFKFGIWFSNCKSCRCFIMHHCFILC